MISLKAVIHPIKFPGVEIQGLDDYICKRFSLNCRRLICQNGKGYLRRANPAGEVTIGMVGKYIELPDAYKSVMKR